MRVSGRGAHAVVNLLFVMALHCCCEWLLCRQPSSLVSTLPSKFRRDEAANLSRITVIFEPVLFPFCASCMHDFVPALWYNSVNLSWRMHLNFNIQELCGVRKGRKLILSCAGSSSSHHPRFATSIAGRLDGARRSEDGQSQRVQKQQVVVPLMPLPLSLASACSWYLSQI